ncbi:MAG: UDP-N-acetylmuramate--L-alanine ligase [Anaerolineales bacterium]|nr:UDP-N-acetylmuramate--L-alanine ligase [Anaerolineales bacterium]
MTIPEAVHLIGIGGTGLSAIARVLLERGCRVSGSDRLLSPLAERLQADGVRILIGHQPGNVLGADLVVRSSAISDDNVEVRAARAAHIPVLKRSEFLGRLISEQRSIAVAGTHGKTTTTAMIAWMLSALGLDPSYIIGGVSTNLGGNAHAGQGQYFVIEADEYDRMFLGLRPELAVITNIEHDHPDCYPTAEEFYQAFSEFSRQLPDDGTLLVCADDQGGMRLIQEARSRPQQVFSYGISAAASDYQAHNLRLNKQGGFTCDVLCPLSGGFELRPALSLQVPGEHNLRNALAALAVAHQLALPLPQAAQALAEFKGTGRRFEVRGEFDGILVIDDYAHHPTEIRATLAAARLRYPERRLWALWQPHTYSRTQMLAAEFAQAFAQADQVVVTEVYASREAPPPGGYSSLRVAEAMPHPGKHFVTGLTEATMLLLEYLVPGDVLLVFSAGDADQISSHVLEALKQMEEYHA